jgi:signal transduction histidine kinase
MATDTIDFRIFVDNMPQIAWSAGPGGDIDYYNKKALDYSGLKQEVRLHLLDTHSKTLKELWKIILHPNDIDHFFALWEDAVRYGASYDMECRLRHHESGMYRWHVCRALPLYDDANHVYRWFGTCTDVHEQKSAQDEMSRLESSKSEFMTLASHQLRTPLTAIRWIFTRLQRSLQGRITPEEERLLVDGKQSVIRMAETITTMLTISKIESGSIHPRMTYFPLLPLLEQIAQQFQYNYEHKHLFCDIRCSPTLVLQSDVHLLQEALRALMSNAIKYTPPGGKVRISATTKEDVCIRMQDSGYGIPPHQQEKVFHKFFRADNIVGRDTEGTGLSLYLVSLITKLLGGSVSFVSKENEGTTFFLNLPNKTSMRR